MKKYNRLKIYSKFLTVLIIILTIFLIILVGYAIYSLYDNYSADESAEELMAQFENNYEEIGEGQISEENPSEGSENPEQPSQGNNSSSNPSKPSTKKPTGSSGSSYNVGTYYKGYKVIGIISIPKLKIQYPIFNVDNTATLRIGTAAIYPSNVEETLNISGNAVIAGHNYRNSRMFSKLHTLQNGDSIFITNNNGVKLEYKVYNNYTAGANDFDYATRDTRGYIEISLSTCTTDASTRTIVWARAE